MRKGYARSSESEELQRQVEQLRGAGCEEALVERETGSAARERLDQYLYDLSPGDELVVCALERLGRTTGKLVAILQGLLRKQVPIIVLEPTPLELSLSAQLSHLDILALLERHERERSRQRYGDGDEPGPNARKRTPTPVEIEEIVQRFEAGESLASIARTLQLHPGAITQALNGRRRLGETFYKAAGGEPRRAPTSLSVRPGFEVAVLSPPRKA